ncbi:peptidylprolyl isomerase [Tautonia plasticadhaerens]|uniref:Peptidylprolyl isomerase n=1 Tax=Tautonia plasticadhaerens TaxID=2527974 RepID=A0A518H040_9BACT|nr:peptidylprolyl isomerase [Tautonia plasticadhaerens]QDV34204.1 peptidylprolyl isomerase [Tautonia plasticadhaerens]
MKRLVGLGMFAAALIGCSQTRDGLQPTAGLAPASLPPGLPPIGDRINNGPVPATGPAPPSTRVSGVSPGVHGEGPIEAPRVAASPADPAPGAPEAGRSSVAAALVDAPVPPPDRAAAGPVGEAARVPADPEISKASAAGPAPVVGQPVGEWAARVDNDIITWNELQSAVVRRMRELSPEQQAAPEVRQMLASSVLDHLIDRSLVIQKARRNELKDPKRWEMINKGAVEFFEEQQLPALLNKYKAEDRYDLERVMAERGESLDEAIDSFKLEFVYQQFLMMNVASKVTVDLPEMRAYYFENRDHESFRRGPELIWRELAVRFANHPGREAARSKIDQATARLARGEPFEQVARELGEGPNASEGGLWTTAPGSYAVGEVNEALAGMSPGQTSAVIEGPTGLHVVRLESSRPAGRLSFEEVQDEIRGLIKARKETELIEDYLKDLYAGAVVTTVFSEYKPRHLREEVAGG